jgi:glycosyltransferase involved in cell wall biosynthesis
MVDRLGLGARVRLPGAVGTEELHRWLRTARALVSLSEHEAFGMVPLEAATAGTRVVLSDIAAHREIADKFLGSAAEVVPAPSVATVPTVTAALARALDRTDRVVVEVPDWSDVASATRTVYLDVLAARSDRGRSGHPFRQSLPSAHERSMQ